MEFGLSFGKKKTTEEWDMVKDCTRDKKLRLNQRACLRGDLTILCGTVCSVMVGAAGSRIEWNVWI